MKRTPLRSKLLAFSFIAFSLAVIALNLLSFGLKTADSLFLFGIIYNFVIMSPLSFFVVESPQWLSKKGKCAKALKSIKKISEKNNNPIDSGEFKRIIGTCEKLMIEHKNNSIPPTNINFDNDRDSKGFSITLFDKTNFLYGIIIALIVFSINSIDSGLTLSLSDIGTDNLQLNGILYGIMQSIGNLLILNRAPQLKRVTTLAMIQILILFGAAFLFGLGFLERKKWVEWVEVGVCEVWITVFMGMAYPMYYLTIAEIFPAEIRGTATSICLLSGKILVSLVPQLLEMTKDRGFNPIVGASLPIFLSLPLTFFLKETNSTHKILKVSISNK